MRMVGAEPLSERLLAFRKRGQIELTRVSQTGLSDGSHAPKRRKQLSCRLTFVAWELRLLFGLRRAKQ